ncbi:unnamed protein product [Strongylus vulgaris]|uniref:Uncharacterized protein n=1 Tax=Strongylus vulgaris TaxID=40348 RepID=A0A3P7J7D1_STRVU|nr:unnamed protein product [Strongylus vulgaris]
MTAMVNGTVKVVAENATCMARCIIPKSDTAYDAGPFIKIPTAEDIACDIIETKCELPDKPANYYMHLQIHQMETTDEYKNSLPNVYVLVLDSVSNLMAKRSGPRDI